MIPVDGLKKRMQRLWEKRFLCWGVDNGLDTKKTSIQTSDPDIIICFCYRLYR